MKPTCMRSLAPSSRLYDAAVTAPRNRRRDECIGWILAGGGRSGRAGCASVRISRRWLTFGMLFRFPLPPKRSYCIVRSLNSMPNVSHRLLILTLAQPARPLLPPPAKIQPMHSSRRLFLGAVTAASYKRLLGANDRIQVGFIGYGLIGRQHVHDFTNQKDADLAAM